MPTLGAPGILAATALAALVVVGVHLLAWRRPRPAPLPTARFAPPQPVRAASRELQLQDAALLALRVLALLAAGAALAAPAVAPARRGTARVIVVDASRRVASLPEVRDALRRAMEGADVSSIVRVDSVARLLPDTALGERAKVRGLLAAGLVAGVREAHRLSATARQVDVVVISPFATESWDTAAVLVRRAWPGEVRTVRVAALTTAPPGDRPPSRAADDLPPATDPVGAAFALGAGVSRAPLRVRRDPPTAADSAWARAGGALVWWPREGAGRRNASGPPPPALLAWDGGATIGRFAPLDIALPTGRVLVRWGDGTPAATEVATGGGCLRTVAASMPSAGDEPLRPGVLRLAELLAMPCGGGTTALVDDATLARWAGGQGTAKGALTSPPATSAPQAPRASPLLVRLLLIVAAALLVAEGWWRRRLGRDAMGGGRGRPAPASAREAA